MKIISSWLLFLACLLTLVSSGAAQIPTSQPLPAGTGFKHRGFYLHGGWFFKYPFAVRTWQRADYDAMFTLLREMGYDQVMIWPMLEAIPMPLSQSDAAALRDFRPVIEDAKAAGLECWLTQCPNLVSPPEIAARPWPQRNPYPVWRQIHLDDPEQAKAYLAHRSERLSILNNADGYVTIDGDPGGYAGAKPEDWLKVFQSDRQAIDRFGVAPKRQKIIPWVWCGWGTKGVWQEPIESFVRPSMELLAKAMPQPWELLPGRSHREGFANGRINIALADELGLMDRSTILCYEAIEFEPTPPAAILQFDLIRQILRQEASYASKARGVFGNAQQPIMVLPNLYFFARCAQDLSYLGRSDEQVLTDFARLLGGQSEVLAPAWSCLRLELSQLPADLPARLRNAKLNSRAGRSIPGGAERYLDILARQVESRRALLEAMSPIDVSDNKVAQHAADGVAALVNWWKVHGYVLDGNGDESFQWGYVHPSQVNILQQWCRAQLKHRPAVVAEAAHLLASRGVLEEKVAADRVAELVGR